jgi:choice-of-anchor B domain-containing protein
MQWFMQGLVAGLWVLGSSSGVVLAQERAEAVTGGRVACTEGLAGTYPCNGVDLLSFLPIDALGGTSGTRVSSTWGWTDPDTGREYALIGLSTGMSFVDVTMPEAPVYLGFLPRTTGAPATIWREFKVYANHLYVVSDAASTHGMQVFDLTHLRGLDGSTPVTFTEDAHYSLVGNAHNIAINEDTGFGYITGATTPGAGINTCGGGLHIVDLHDPKAPTFVDCFTHPLDNLSRAYTHDVLCVVYHGPDTDYTGREICLASNEDVLSIADVTDKASMVNLSVANPPQAEYIHQGWLTEDHRYFYVDDELDEVRLGLNTRTLIYDLADLDNPVFVGEYLATTTAIDHNQYVAGDYLVQANYTAGVRFLDISDPLAPQEVAFFDTYPANDSPSFLSIWNVYPFFASGNVLAGGIGEGLFVLRTTAFQLEREEPVEVPGAHLFSGVYPQPFGDTATFTLALHDPQAVQVEVFDLQGRLQATLHEGTLTAGELHRFHLAATGWAAGVYLLRIRGEQFAASYPLVHVR